MLGNNMETITKTKDTLISLKVVAARLGLSTRAVYRLIASGTLPRPFKVGGAVRFFESDIEKYFANLQATRR
jgi:excisionase family DNA binding protein